MRTLEEVLGLTSRKVNKSRRQGYPGNRP